MDMLEYYKQLAQGRLALLEHQHTKAVAQQDKIDNLETRIDRLCKERDVPHPTLASHIDWHVEYNTVCEELAAVQMDRRKVNASLQEMYRKYTKLYNTKSADCVRRNELLSYELASLRRKYELRSKELASLREVFKKRTNALLAIRNEATTANTKLHATVNKALGIIR
jgi:hypothetical protein